MHIQNSYSGNVFSKGEPNIILQAMLCGDGIVICELVSRKDFEEEQP